MNKSNKVKIKEKYLLKNVVSIFFFWTLKWVLARFLTTVILLY